MDIILLEKVANLGNLGDKVTVRPGYGRNFLIPKGKAVRATATKLAEFEQRRAELEQKAAADLTNAQARSERLRQLKVVIARKAGDEGRLYGSVGTRDIAEAITAAGEPVEKQEIRLSNGALRLLGDHEIKLHIHSDITASVTVSIVAE